MSDNKAFLDWNPMGNNEPFPGETLVADGWKYKDFPPMLQEYWDYFLAIFGEGNYRLLTFMERTFKDDERLYVRGQMYISPTGLENVKKYSDSGKKFPEPP